MQSVTIRDFETDDELGVLHQDGTLDTEDPYLREIYEEILEDGDEYGAPMMDGYYDPKEEAHCDGFVFIEPGEKGFLLAVHEALPSPYELAPEKARKLETPDKRLNRPDHIED